MLSIKTHFHPFRLKLRDKKPVQLTVELENRGDRNELVSMELALARLLSFDKSGIVRSKVERIDGLAPGEGKKFYYDIYPKALADPGELDVQMRITEHHKDWKMVDRTYTKDMQLIVEG